LWEPAAAAGGTEFIVPATHRDRDIDETVVAFEEVMIALRRKAII
jgi:hypothetical protein